MRIQEISVCNAVARYLNSPIILPSSIIKECQGKILEARPYFPQEKSWVANKYQEPSLIYRIDGTITPDGNLAIYEIDVKPRGIGIVSLVDPEAKEKLDFLKKSWPKFKVCLIEEGYMTDDYLWNEVISISEALNKDSTWLLLIRAEPTQMLVQSLIPRSVTPVMTDGDKKYGLTLGMWHQACSKLTENGDLLPWESGFSLKPLRGSKMQDVHIWTPEKRQGRSSRKQIKETLARHNTMYCQPFLAPVDTGIEQFPYAVLRLFFGFNPKSREGNNYEYIGGCAVAGKTLRLHGTPDTVAVPIIFGR